MSEVAIGRRVPNGNTLFAPRTIALLLFVGLLGFAGSMLLGAYAPDFSAGRSAGPHALSRAATGYSGIVRLTQAIGRNPRLIRAEAGWDTEDLVIATPEHGTVDIGKFVTARRGRATLIVLPKWATTPDEQTKGWVDMSGLLPAKDPAAMLEPGTTMPVTRRRSGARPLRPMRWVPQSLAVAAPRPVQTVRSAALTALVEDDAGGIVLGRLNDTNIYILADPDLLNNHGIRRIARARAAVDLLDFINATGAQGMAFDVTLNGLGHGRSPLRLAFEPPFLAMTLAITAALVLVGWQALVRFGPARPPVRAIAFGKTALIDNSAMIVRKAGREGGLGGRYAALVRERARTIFGVPAHLTDEAADGYLDRLQGTARFTQLAADAQRASHPADMLAAAQALHQWQQEKTR
ncbi:hypothetical protein [Sphingomonas montana]|uniref:hypothetical protein n=1 Tax=Sphingomonas montana TaxID=1843236 RepID=UPI00096EE8DA|nr:hypothetical protein [Sphingomonas montana]